MKLRFTLVAMLLASVLVCASINIAEAQWDALSSGYAVTTDQHGKIVPIGLPVTAIAGTNDSTVKTVEFVWHFPNGSVYVDPPPRIPVFGPYKTPNVPLGVPEEIVDWARLRDGSVDPGHFPQVDVWYANNTQIPNVIGDWGVQAIFHDGVASAHHIRGKNSDTVAIRATSFNVVPEVQFGTIAILLGWFGVLGIFALRKKHFHEPTPI